MRPARNQLYLLSGLLLVGLLASEAFGDDSEAKRPTVQVGDPFTEKLLIECTLELFADDLVVGIQDLFGLGDIVAHLAALFPGDADQCVDVVSHHRGLG